MFLTSWMRSAVRLGCRGGRNHHSPEGLLDSATSTFARAIAPMRSWSLRDQDGGSVDDLLRP